MVYLRVDDLLLPLASSHDRYWAIQAGKAALKIHSEGIEVREYPHGRVIWNLNIEAQLQAEAEAEAMTEAEAKAMAEARAIAKADAVKARAGLMAEARAGARAEAELQAEPEVISRIVDCFNG